jgi:hypothetical protein
MSTNVPDPNLPQGEDISTESSLGDSSQPDHPMPPSFPTWNEYKAITGAVLGLQNQIKDQEETHRVIGRAFEGLVRQVEKMSTKNSSSEPKGAPRFKEPRVFNGNASEAVPFLNEIEDAVKLSRTTLPTESDKAMYLASYLGNGSPMSWYTALKLTSPHLLDNFPLFVQNFRDHFGDSDLEGTSLRKIEALKQTGACATYASRFKELLVHVDFSESTKINKFKEGLKPEVKDVLVNIMDKPKQFDKYIDLCIRIDNHVHQRDLERQAAKKASSSNQSSNNNPRNTNTSTRTQSSQHQFNFPPPPTTSTSSTSDLPPGEPMQIDATKMKRCPLTPEERKRRHDLGLCSYCGGQHNVTKCPNMSERAKKNYAAKRNASSSSGKA